MPFCESIFPAGHVSQAESDGEHVESGVFERKAEAVGHDQIGEASPTRVLEHGLAEIGTDDLSARTLLEDFSSDIAASCGHIEEQHGLFLLDAADELPPPEDVCSHTENVIRQHIAIGDVRECAPNKSWILHNGESVRVLMLADDPAFA